jgi:hypothetical protein
MLGICVALEAFARFGLGLGSPPLSITDPKIEYMFAPNQDVRRFHNRFLTNEFGMRSPPLGNRQHERVILVFGDSVLNGGSLTDQGQLATTLAANRLSSDVGRAVYVGNVSAGSWGIRNINGWLETYGTLGADTFILVLNSGDVTDFPTFESLNPSTHPVRPPPSAFVELVQRYLPRLLSEIAFHQGEDVVATSGEPSAYEVITEGQQDLVELLDNAAAVGIRVCLVQHLTRTELQTEPEPGFEATRSVFEAREVPSISMERYLIHALNDGREPYRDDIHVSDEGQKLLAEVLLKCDRLARPPLIGRASDRSFGAPKAEH